MEGAIALEVLPRLISSVPRGSCLSLLSANAIKIDSYHPVVDLLAFVSNLYNINQVNKPTKVADLGNLGRKAAIISGYH